MYFFGKTFAFNFRGNSLSDAHVPKHAASLFPRMRQSPKLRFLKKMRSRIAFPEKKKKKGNRKPTQNLVGDQNIFGICWFCCGAMFLKLHFFLFPKKSLPHFFALLAENERCKKEMTDFFLVFFSFLPFSFKFLTVAAIWVVRRAKTDDDCSLFLFNFSSPLSSSG